MPLPKPGEEVVLDGFVARRALNGRIGTVVAHRNGDHHDTESGRVRVHLHGTPFTIKVHAEQCFRPMEVPIGQVNPEEIKPVTPPVAPTVQELPEKRGKLREPMMAAVSGHVPCGKVYAEIQATFGRDVHRLRNLGLNFFKDLQVDVPKRLRTGPPRAHHTQLTKEKYDWRQPIPKYIDPSQIPHEMGGHGKEMFDLEVKALMSPRIVPPRSEMMNLKFEEGGSPPTQNSWSSKTGIGEPLDTTDAFSDGDSRYLSPLQAGPALSKWRREGDDDWATTVMSELAREADWASMEPSTTIGGGLSTDWGSMSVMDPAGWPPHSSSTMENEDTTAEGITQTQGAEEAPELGLALAALQRKVDEMPRE